MAQTHFTVHQPKTIEEALDLLSMHRSSVRVLAGGTDLVPRLRAGIDDTKHLVSINRVKGIRRINYQDEDGLIIGAASRISEVGKHADVQKYYPGLAHACQKMATVQIRNMGTVVGNLANSSPSADTAAPLLSQRASLILVERGGRRQVDLKDFFTGPGENVMDPFEMIEAIRIPSPPQRTGSAYLRISARSKVDIAAVGVAASLTLDMDGKILKSSIALGSVAPTPVRCPEAEAMLEGQVPEEALLMRAGAACVRTARPIDDMRATGSYRRKMVQVLAQRVLLECLKRAQGGIK
jgi:carbon-monoxide dehydrogenase medium subunit